MMLRDNGPDASTPTILNHDTLDLMENIRNRNPALAEGKFDLILTNPPLGQSITRRTHGDAAVDQFDIARNGRNRRPTSVQTEAAFLDRVHTFLKPGTARASVLVPDGLLSNTSMQPARDWILGHFQLLAVISLPQHALNHQGSGAKTSFIFLRKLAQNETVPDDTPVFMAMPESIGYDAAGRLTWDRVETESETPGYERTVLQQCDLFHQRSRYHIHHEHSPAAGVQQVLTNSGLLAEWKKFKKNPGSFLT